MLSILGVNNTTPRSKGVSPQVRAMGKSQPGDVAQRLGMPRHPNAPRIKSEMGIASVEVPLKAGFTANDAGIVSAPPPLAHNDMRTTLGGIVSRTDSKSDPDHDGH